MIQRLFKSPVLALLASVLCVCFSCSENHKERTSQPAVHAAIDSIFSEIEDNQAPGISAILWYDEKIAYQTHKGLSNLQKASKIDANTAFNIGQISDHFTAYGVLKLVLEGKLDLEKNLNVYLNTSSILLDQITVKHLLSHSTGLYDISVLSEVAEQNLTTTRKVLSHIESQTEFSFLPGTEFVLNRTNIFLLERVLEKVSGKAIQNFMEEEIFQPAGLTNTFYTDSVNEIENVALSYEMDGDSYLQANDEFDMFSTRVYSSTKDLLAWERFLVQRKAKGARIVELLNTVATLDNGMQFNQPAGKLTYGQRFINAERGVLELYNTGEQSGFASSIFRFPTVDFISIILTNNGLDYSGYFGIISSYELMEEVFTEPASTDFNNLPQLALNNQELEAYTGRFWDEEGEYVREIRVNDDTLRYVRSEENQSALLPIAKDTFQMVFPYDEIILVTFSENEDGRMMNYVISDADPIPFTEVLENNVEEVDMNGFLGKYRNDSFGISFDITIRNDSILLAGKNKNELSYGPLKDGLFVGGDWYLQSITFQKDSVSGKVVGFKANNPALKNLFFKKQSN